MVRVIAAIVALLFVTNAAMADFTAFEKTYTKCFNKDWKVREKPYDCYGPNATELFTAMQGVGFKELTTVGAAGKIVRYTRERAFDVQNPIKCRYDPYDRHQKYLCQFLRRAPRPFMYLGQKL